MKLAQQVKKFYYIIKKFEKNHDVKIGVTVDK